MLHARVSVNATPAGRPAVVLVHGLTVSSLDMLPTAERLAALCPVYAPGLPGCGESEKPKHALSVPELADVLAAWMQVIGLARAVLIGNSLGCQVAVDGAVHHPEQVEGLVLIGPTVDPKGTFARYHTELKKIAARYPLLGPLALSQLDAFLAEAGGRYRVWWLKEPIALERRVCCGYDSCWSASDAAGSRNRAGRGRPGALATDEGD
jgi:pimeloyl-ACP methyl ester carboxylesterase